MTKHTAAPCHHGGYEIQDDKGALICNLSGWRGEQQTLANAKLIAAAPELLEELKQVMTWIDNWSPEFTYDPDWSVDKEKAQAAIAKAEVKHD